MTKTEIVNKISETYSPLTLECQQKLSDGAKILSLKKNTTIEPTFVRKIMKRIHYISGLTITIFIGLHLFNHLISIFGAAYHIELMNKLRVVYRNPIIETILLAAVLIQIISGLNLSLSKRQLANGFYDKLQIWTGLYLALFLLFHVGAVLTGRYLLKLDTNFYFGVAGLNTFPFNLFFIPYYGLAILSFFGHIAAIHFQKMKQKIFGLTIQQQSNLIFITGVIVTVIIFYGLTNGFTGVEIPEAYHVIIGK